MTAPPLPASPCVRVRMDYTQVDTQLAGNRFYLSYAGGAPTAGNCITLATDIAAAWATHLAPNIDQAYVLTEVDVLDIASLTGASGQWTGNNAGGMTDTSLSANAAMNIEFGIARRYRGGKPRIFLPPPDHTALNSPARWKPDFLATVQTAIGAFFAELEALDIGAMGALSHVNLSYYQGFKNITNSSGRERAVPQYRDTALLDTIESYIAKGVVGSQRRRRIASTY